MPILNGHQVAARLDSGRQRVKTLVLSGHSDRQYILSVFGSGVAGYILKEDVPNTLVDAVLSIAAGDSSWISRSVAEKLVPGGPERDCRKLTEGEQEILRLIQAGLGDAQIAERLQVNDKAVARMVVMILARLKIRSRWELGLVEPW
jgi:DNA-binding NarL/FixJ family response regulator